MTVWMRNIALVTCGIFLGCDGEGLQRRFSNEHSLGPHSYTAAKIMVDSTTCILVIGGAYPAPTISCDWK